MTVTSFSQGQLRSYFERIERLEDEISGLNKDKSDIYTEAKSNGFDAKVMRAVYRRWIGHRKDKASAQEFEAMCDIYAHSVGLAEDEPRARAREAAA